MLHFFIVTLTFAKPVSGSAAFRVECGAGMKVRVLPIKIVVSDNILKDSKIHFRSPPGLTLRTCYFLFMICDFKLYLNIDTDNQVTFWIHYPFKLSLCCEMRELESDGGSPLPVGIMWELQQIMDA